jgi:hypothetical protein
MKKNDIVTSNDEIEKTKNLMGKKKSIVQNKNSAIHSENECGASITCEL